MKHWFEAWCGLLCCALLPAPANAQWYSFTWAELPGSAGSKGAIMLPVELDGVHCQMQLDTGAPASVLYRNALPLKFAPGRDGEQMTIADFRLGQERSTRVLGLMYSPRPDGQPAECDSVVGTIGNTYLTGARLTLDLPRAQFQIQRGAAPERREHDRADVHVLDMALLAFPGAGNVMPALSATLPNGERIKLMLDTGSAPIEINVFLERNWLKLVGLHNLADARAFAVPRWGAWIHCYSAPTKAPVSFGDLVLKAGANATYCVDPRAEPPSEQNQLYGLVGLAMFRNDRITLDYAAGKLIVAPSAAQR
jgi:hypothetical protein